MGLTISTIMLGVQDLDKAKKFYAEGMGATLEKDFPGFVSVVLGESFTTLALYQWDAAAKDAGVSPEGSGFRGISLHYVANSREEVDEVIATAEAAGGTVIRTPEAAKWGGYFGYFADPDGYLWKIATGG